MRSAFSLVGALCIFSTWMSRATPTMPGRNSSSWLGSASLSGRPTGLSLTSTRSQSGSTTDPRGIEFHGAPMRAGKEEWQGIKPADRVQAVVDILSLLADRQLKLKVFASVIEEEHDGSRRDRATKLRKRRERI